MNKKENRENSFPLKAFMPEATVPNHQRYSCYIAALQSTFNNLGPCYQSKDECRGLWILINKLQGENIINFFYQCILS